MKRYAFLSSTSLFAALNKLRAAFLAAKNGDEVDEIIKGILTSDERTKLGRRIQVAEMLMQGNTFAEVIQELKVGRSTVQLVARKLRKNERAYRLIATKLQKVEKEFRKKAYVKHGGAKKIIKKTEYTGFKRKDVAR